MAIRSNVRFWMHKAGFKSVASLSRQVGLSPLGLTNLMKGKTKGIEFRTLDALCRALGCGPGDLFSYDPQWKESVYVYDADNR